jgi:hypothetical protein
MLALIRHLYQASRRDAGRGERGSQALKYLAKIGRPSGTEATQKMRVTLSARFSQPVGP